MRKFIRSCLFFGCFTIGVYVVLIFTTTRIIDNKISFKLPETIDKIVLGHSHPECALNDSLVNGLANFSNSGEAYFYAYYKLKKILNHNKNIKTVFIELSNKQITKRADEWIWSSQYIEARYPSYASFIDQEGHTLLFNKNRWEYLNRTNMLLSTNMKLLKSHAYDYSRKVGGYLCLNKNKIDSFLLLPPQIEEEVLFRQKSIYNLMYLDKTIQYCISKGVKPVLIRCPVHPNFAEFKNEKKYQFILKNRYKNVVFLDFVKFQLPNKEFADMEHLNYIGARRFSLFFDSIIKDGLVTNLQKQKMIDDRIQSNRTK
jgi:hypothetical protein